MRRTVKVPTYSNCFPRLEKRNHPCCACFSVLVVDIGKPGIYRCSVCSLFSHRTSSPQISHGGFTVPRAFSDAVRGPNHAIPLLTAHSQAVGTDLQRRTTIQCSLHVTSDGRRCLSWCVHCLAFHSRPRTRANSFCNTIFLFGNCCHAVCTCTDSTIFSSLDLEPNPSQRRRVGLRLSCLR